MNKFVLRQSLILLLTAVIWGVAFVAQSVGMDYVEPFTFIAVRNVIGALVLIPCIALMDRINKRQDSKSGANTIKNKGNVRTLITVGICCGICLFTASSLQQFGVKYTTVGKAGFITAMYMVLVPIVGIFFHKKAGKKMLAAASLILSLESVVSVLAGWIILHQALTPRQIIGCILAFAAIVLVQLPNKADKTE